MRCQGSCVKRFNVGWSDVSQRGIDATDANIIKVEIPRRLIYDGFLQRCLRQTFGKFGLLKVQVHGVVLRLPIYPTRAAQLRTLRHNLQSPLSLPQPHRKHG